MKSLISIISILILFSGILIAAEDDFSSEIIHVGVVVSDLEESLDFYTRVIGMVQMDQEAFDVDADVAKRTGLTEGIPFQVEVLKLGSGPNANQYKIMSFGNRAQKQENEYLINHTGMQYITIFVNELEPIIHRIEAHQVKLLGETPALLPDSNYFVLIQDPDGTFIELIGPMEQEE